MSKILSEKERKLQKKLIPLNIFVCILALAAAISLFFAPILKVDVGKIIKHKDFVAYIEETMDKQIGSDIEGTEQEGIDFKPVVAKIVKEVLSSTEGTLSISALGASKVAFAAEENKSSAVLDELLFGENALVGKLIDSVVNGVANIFKEPEGQTILEETVVTAIASSISKETNVDFLTKDNVEDITGTFKEQLALANKEGDVTDMVSAVVTQIEEISKANGNEIKFSEDDVAAITEEIQKIYDDTVKELAPGTAVTMENLICVAVSSNVDLADFDLDKILDEMLGGEESNPENGEEGKEGTSFALAEGETSSEGGTEPEPDKEIVTTYDGLLKQMNFDEDSLKVKLKTNLNKLVDDMVKENGIDEYAGYYGYLFYGWLAFVAPWLILFLFAFFHMLAKNKRFTMWYVKLYSWLPCLVFFIAPLVAPKILELVAPQVLEGDTGKLIPAILSGVSSYTVISGACYLLLWLVSIFWAFPIKRKIRKERKACKKAKKNGTYDYYASSDPSGAKGKKNKKGKKNAQPAESAAAYGGETYGGGGGYGGTDNLYGDSYGDSYGSGYGSSDSLYGDSYGDAYDDYDDYGDYGDSYGDSYGGSDSGFDDDYDDYGDSYGSSYLDDDDDDDLF